MKFFYSDTMDLVDPLYNFETDTSPKERERYWDDVYAHEILSSPPYDGLLISMSSIRKSRKIRSGTVKYTPAEEQRLIRDGARKFLRMNKPEFARLSIMGDCGAFAYASESLPAYSPGEVVEFYLDTGVDLGVAPDHIIFECDLDNPPAKDQSTATLTRFQITLENAEKFLRLAKNEGAEFTPVATVQGWSPNSMADAAEALVKMGYNYLAIGGLVPLGPETIAKILFAIRERIGLDTEIHLLGFAKADSIDRFLKYRITSFDSTSPLIRAFKDARRNYFVDTGTKTLDYYMAIRVPQALENPTLMQAVKRGQLNPESLVKSERQVLDILKRFSQRRVSVTETVDTVLEYSRLLSSPSESQTKVDRELERSREGILRTLTDRPWETCKCCICKEIGIQVLIFRASNRNKRRGMHNLFVYHNHVKRIISEEQT